MEAVPASLTDDDLVRIGQSNPGWRIERRDGALLMTPPTGGRTGRHNAWINWLLFEYARTHGCVALDSTTGIGLPSGDLLSADGALVDAAEWDSLTPEQQDRFVALRPAAIVEVRSPSDRLPTLVAKCELWFDQGAGFVVLVDPSTERVRTWGTPLPEFPDLSKSP